MSYFHRWRVAKAKSETRFFSGETPLVSATHYNRKTFAKLFPGQVGISGRGQYYLGTEAFWVGRTAEGKELPVTRIIGYSSNPSLHACNAKCQNATGPNCECICGGANHGIMNNAGMP